MGMTLDDIKTKIGRRVGDPLLDTYADEVQDYFEQALTTLVRKTGDKSLVPVYLNEITPLLKTKDITLTFVNNISFYTISKDNFPDLMQIYKIIKSTSRNNKIYTYLPLDTFNLIVKNSDVTPVGIQRYWTMDGFLLRIYSIETTEYIKIEYISNPKPSEWNTTDDFVNDLGYGYGFIIDCIELASSLLRRQIGIEG